MSDSEGTAAAPHPTTGGKSIESIESIQAQQNRMQGERQPYKSWRKKYRKMRVKFDDALDGNKTLFKQEHKLEGTAKRLREELDELLEILLDMNQSAAIPTDLRYDVRLPIQREYNDLVRSDITPQEANELVAQYTRAVSNGTIPPLDLQIVREEVDERLAAQGVQPLEVLEKSVTHPIATSEKDLPEEDRGDEPPNYLSTSQEAEYLQRLDAKLGDRLSLDKETTRPPIPHQAELTPRELERHMELLNPQSQHNWLKTHSKMHAALDIEDTESLASHEGGSSKPAGRKRGKNLAKQVGDRAVERAYEGIGSPSAASGFDEEEMQTTEDAPGSGRKRARDRDGAYRVKGGRGGMKGKRKRATEEGAGTSKKARMSESFAEP